MKLEEMGAFFDARLGDYDNHQLTCIDCAQEFYPFTASLLPQTQDAEILDLGCGTGLELESYFRCNPTAHVTGIDLAPGMLDALRQKFPRQKLTLIQDSYFTVPFGDGRFDAVVSVESLHHFTQEEKIPLYQKVYRALKPGGFLVLTDYFALSEQEEQQHRQELLRMKQEQGLSDHVFYHYDTPLTVAHELEAMKQGGFDRIEVIQSWGATHCILARKA